MFVLGITQAKRIILVVNMNVSLICDSAMLMWQDMTRQDKGRGMTTNLGE